MRALVIGLGLVFGTLLVVLIGGMITPNGPDVTVRALEPQAPGPEIAPLPIRHETALPAPARNKPETFVKLARQRVAKARNIDEDFEAAESLSSALQRVGKFEAADEALRQAADFAEARPKGALEENGQPTPFAGPEGGARTMLAHAHREIVHGNIEAAKRHLNQFIDRYAERSPSLVQQAASDLAWLEQYKEGAPQAPRLAEGPKASVPHGAQPASGVVARQTPGVQTTLVLATSEANTVIFSGAQSGKTYSVTASGVWAQDPDPQFDPGPDGLTSFGSISDGPFAGMFFGTFAAQEPSGSLWQAVGASGSVTATADGDILGSFADILGLYFDNNGVMFVSGAEEGSEPPPGVTTPPIAVAQVSPQTVCVYNAGLEVFMDGSLSADTDETGDAPAILWFHWSLVNLTNPAVRPLAFEGPNPFANPSGLNEAGEYEVTLRVMDNDGELATASQPLTVVGIAFDPPSIEVPIGDTVTSNAEVVPATSADGITFDFSVPDRASFQATNLGGGVIEVQVTGMAEGDTELLAQVPGEFGPENCEALFINVVPPSNKTPPVAIAETTTPVICAGGTVTLDGSGSHDTDTVNDDQILPQIQNYAWTLVNLTNPGQPPITISTTSAITTTVLNAPGEYQVTLVVTDNDGDPSMDGSSDAHVTILAVGVSFNPPTLTVQAGASDTTVGTIVPSNAADKVSFQITDTGIASIPATLPVAATTPIPVTGLTPGTTSLVALLNTGQEPASCGEAEIIVTPPPQGAVAAIVDTEDNVLEFLGHKLDKLPVDSQGFGTVVSLQFGSSTAVAARASNLAPVELSPDRVDTLNLDLTRNQDGFSEQVTLTETGVDTLDFFSADGTVIAQVTRPPENDTKRIDTMELTLTSTRYLAIDTAFNLIETGKNTRTFKSPDRGLSVLFLSRPGPSRRDLALAFTFDATTFDLAPALLIETGKDTLEFRSPNGKTQLVLAPDTAFDAASADTLHVRYSDTRMGVSDAPLQLLESAADSLYFQSRGAGLSGSNTIVIRAEMSKEDAGDPPSKTTTADLTAKNPDGTESNLNGITLHLQAGTGEKVVYVSDFIPVEEAGGNGKELTIQAQEGATITAVVKKPAKNNETIKSNQVSVYSVILEKETTKRAVVGSSVEIVLRVSTGNTGTPSPPDLTGRVEITDKAGNKVRDIVAPISVVDGAVVVAWNGKDNKGGVVGAGKYGVTVTTIPPNAPPTSTAKSNETTITYVPIGDLPTAKIEDEDHLKVMVAKGVVEGAPGSTNDDVNVTISNLQPGQKVEVIVLEAKGGGTCTIEGKGKRFEVNANGTQKISLRGGDKVSTSRHDITLAVRTIAGKPEDSIQLASENFTTFWVDLSLLENGAKVPDKAVAEKESEPKLLDQQRAITGKDTVGMYENETKIGFLWGGSELTVGKIRPKGMLKSDFVNSNTVGAHRGDGFFFVRTLNRRMYSDDAFETQTDTTHTGVPSNGDNIKDTINNNTGEKLTSEMDLDPDPDPDSSGSLVIYSHDAPGLNLKERSTIVGSTLRDRRNFSDHVLYKNVLCSNTVAWHMHQSIRRKKFSAPESEGDFERLADDNEKGDNSIGSGHLPLTSDMGAGDAPLPAFEIHTASSPQAAGGKFFLRTAPNRFTFVLDGARIPLDGPLEVAFKEVTSKGPSITTLAITTRTATRIEGTAEFANRDKPGIYQVYVTAQGISVTPVNGFVAFGPLFDWEWLNAVLIQAQGGFFVVAFVRPVDELKLPVLPPPPAPKVTRTGGNIEGDVQRVEFDNGQSAFGVLIKVTLPVLPPEPMTIELNAEGSDKSKDSALRVIKQ